MAHTPGQARRAGIAALVGTTLEWYDFLVYGTAAALVLNKLFFPSVSSTAGTLATFATYAVGFLARPLGGMVLGSMGDRLGRKTMLIGTLLMMGTATTLIGLLPTYSSIGMWAPLLLIVLRLVQGFGAGGEYAGAVVFSVEYGDQRRRGLAGAWAPAGYALATLLATGVFQLLILMPDAQFRAWGWRVPFLLGALVLAIGYVLRRGIHETPAFEAARRSEQPEVSLLAALRRHPRNFLVVVGARFAENGFAYLFPVFAVSFLAHQLHAPESVGLVAVIVASVVQIAAIPLFAWLSDRWGRRPVYAVGAIASLAWSAPFFLILDTLSPVAITLAFVVGLGICYPAMLAPQAAWFAELFDTRTRLAGFAFAREIGSVLAGGFLPLIATALLTWSGHWWPVVVYLGLLTALTLVALLVGPETRRSGLEPAPRPDSAPAPAAHRPG
jgi:MFS family permease